MCPISPNYLYVGIFIAAVIFSLYLASKGQSNPYENRTIFADAKRGNKWAKACVVYSIVFGVFMVAFFSCIGS